MTPEFLITTLMLREERARPARVERQSRSSNSSAGDWGERVAAPVGGGGQTNEETPLDAP